MKAKSCLALALVLALVLAVGLAALGCSSSPSSKPNPSGTQPGTNASCNVATLPADTNVVNISLFGNGTGFSVDSAGIAFLSLPANAPTDGGSPGSVETASFSGAVTTLYSLTGSQFPGSLLSDANHVYVTFPGFLGGGGLFSLPRTTPSATLTPVYMETSNTSLLTFALDADTLYLSVTDTTQTPGTGSILSVAKAGGAPATLYTAPAGQLINNLFVDGTTLWWSEESAQISTVGPTVLRSAPIAATLSPTLFATVPAPFVVIGIVEYMGTVVFENSPITVTLDGGLSLATGMYAVSQNGMPTMADPDGLFPITIGPAGAVYYPAIEGIRKLTLSAAGASAPTTVVPNVGGLGVSVDSSGTLYYATGTCIDKL